MKKLLVVLALLLIPAMAFAGSATSRWDLTVGGFVKAEFGYSDQLRAQNNQIPIRESRGDTKVLGAEYGNYFSSGVESRFNFLIKGPDAWGMKTSAFLEGDFYGTPTPSTHGLFRLRHAWIRFTGSSMELQAGQASQIFGSLTGTAQALLTILPWMDSALPVGAGRMPHISAEFSFTKDFKALFGVFVNDNPVGATGTGDVDNYTMGSPYVHARLRYESDFLGKIGPDRFTFLVDGFYGKDKRLLDATNNAITVTPGSVAITGTTNTTLSNCYTKIRSKTLDSWGAHSSILIPILRERQGNKQGALAISGFGFAMQNPGDQGIPGNVFSGGSQTPYYRAGSDDYASLLITGWGAQMYTYFTDKVFFSANYSTVDAKMSQRYRNVAGNAGNLKSRKSYVFILAYDPNPAVKLTLDWEMSKADFANYGTAATGATTKPDKRAKVNVFRLGAFYFF